MDRRFLLKLVAGLPFVGAPRRRLVKGRVAPILARSPGRSRLAVRGPLEGASAATSRASLIKVELAARRLRRRAAGAACAQVFKELKNPYYLGDEVGLPSRSAGSAPGRRSRASTRSPRKSTADVVAAVNFARTHNLRLVVKGGGHSYQGTSNAAEFAADLDPAHARRHAA